MTGESVRVMKKITRQRGMAAVLCSALLCLCCLCPDRAGAFTDSLVNVQVLLPGNTKIIEFGQTGLFPFGCPHFFLFVSGQGTLGLSLKKDDAAGDGLFMLGQAWSGAGTETISRFGISQQMIDQIVEIGSASQPWGLVWLYCGVVFSINNPTYLYDVRLSFQP